MPPSAMNRPKHPASPQYKHLFKGVCNFRELEARIEKESFCGTAFEVFSEAYIATQCQSEYQEFWPHGTVPLPVCRELHIPRGDKGVDGVGADRRNTYAAFQFKFRTGRPKLRYEEVGTFGYLSDRCGAKIIVANCNKAATTIKQRKHTYCITYCILGPDLDELRPEDFQAMEAWLEGEPFERSKPVAKDYQQEAIDKLNKVLETDDRASCIMWCGTGKTLVALWLKESRLPGKTLVLVPTVDLLGQIRQNWNRDCREDYDPLYVCSDLDNPRADYWLKRNDCPFQITTDPEIVRRYLDNGNGLPQVIFSTYHSSPVIKEAMRKGEAFDLAIFDEAHRTAGRVERNFLTALDNSQIAIKKRVFFTATPRHCRRNNGQLVELYSMDDESVYGNQVVKLSAKQAIEKEIVCSYKVLITVITSDKVNDWLLSHGEVNRLGDPVLARQVANQLALADAIRTHGIKASFTFHKSIDSAESYTSPGPGGIGSHLEGQDVETYSISSRMWRSRR
jgi:predicted helicase